MSSVAGLGQGDREPATILKLRRSLMKYLLGLAALVVCLAPVSRGADEENPFKKAKVGDWASYTMKTTAMGVNIDAEMKTIVTAKDDKEVTIKTSLILNKMDIPGQESKIDLTKPYDPTS